MSTSNASTTAVQPAHSIQTIVAWTAMLIVSPLPEIISALITSSPFEWFIWFDSGALLVLLALSFIQRIEGVTSHQCVWLVQHGSRNQASRGPKRQSSLYLQRQP